MSSSTISTAVRAGDEKRGTSIPAQTTRRFRHQLRRRVAGECFWQAEGAEVSLCFLMNQSCRADAGSMSSQAKPTKTHVIRAKPRGAGCLAVPMNEPATGRLGALDDLTNVVVQSVTSGSPSGTRVGTARHLRGGRLRRRGIPGMWLIGNSSNKIDNIPLVRVRGAASVIRTGVWTAWSRWPMYANMRRAKDAASDHA